MVFAITALIGVLACVPKEEQMMIQKFEEEYHCGFRMKSVSHLCGDNTRKLYYGCTRAGQKLVLTNAGDLPTVAKAMLKMKDRVKL